MANLDPKQNHKHDHLISVAIEDYIKGIVFKYDIKNLWIFPFIF